MLMAGERKRVMGELAAWHVAMVSAMFGGQVSPTELNPYRVWTRAEIEARQKAEKQRFWAAMGAGMFGSAKPFIKPTGES